MAKQEKPVLEAAMQDIWALGHRFHHQMAMIHDCVVEVLPFDGRIHLAGIISTVECGKGNASRALDAVLAVCDKHQCEAHLTVVPVKNAVVERKLTKAQLAAWYKRRGFDWQVRNGVKSKEHMIRQPKAQEAAQ